MGFLGQNVNTYSMWVKQKWAPEWYMRGLDPLSGLVSLQILCPAVQTASANLLKGDDSDL